MDFDPNSATPVPFDPTTAKPVDEFDTIIPTAANTPHNQDQSHPISILGAIESPWAEDPLNIAGTTASQEQGLNGVPDLAKPAIRAVDAFGNVIGKGFETVSRGLGATAGRIAQGLGASDTSAHQLERDVYSLPSALGPLGAEHPIGETAPKPPAETLADIAKGEAPAATREPSYGPKPPAKATPEPEAAPPSPPPNPSEVKPTAPNPFDQFDPTAAKPVELSMAEVPPTPETPPGIEVPETRGQGIFYHGTSRPIDNLYDYYGSDLNYYGSGLYTTDAMDIARGYSRKGRGGSPTIYRTTENGPVKLFDMEAPLNGEPLDIAKNVAKYDEVAAQALEDKPTNMREFFDNIRDVGTSEMMSASEIQEIFDGIGENLESRGYNGMQHTGGLRAGKSPHTVRIYFRPSQHLGLERSTPVLGRNIAEDISREPTATPEANPFDEFDATTAKSVEANPFDEFDPNMGLPPIDNASLPIDHMASEKPTELSRDGGEGAVEPPEQPPQEPPVSGDGGDEFNPPVPTADNPAPMHQWIRGQEDELYRLSGQNESDRTEGLKYISAIPDPLKDPVLQEKLYHHAEDESYPLTPDEQAIYDRYLGPIRDEATAAINRIKGAGYNVNSDGYIHRIVQGKGSMYDPNEGPIQTDAFGPQSLGRKTPSMMNRTMFKAVRDDGTGEIVNGNYKPGQDYTFADGTKGKIRQATTREIEEATPLRYYKNAIANSLDNLLRLRRVERNIKYLDGLKDTLQKNGLAYPPQVRGKIGDNGGPAMEENTPPSDYRTVDLPQLAGWQIHPRIAKMLDNFYGKPPQDIINRTLTPVNKLLTKAIFINPISAAFGHGANVAAHWFVGRGLDNFMPQTWARSAVNMFRAFDDVKNLSPLYQKIQREGGALLYAPTLNRDFHQSMVKLMGSDVQKHPETWGQIARAAGAVPGDVLNALSNFSSEGLWFLNDIFVMGRVRDLMDKGMSQRRAIKTTGEEIPTYRIPTESWDGPGGTMFSDVMRNPNVFLFGRYRYNMLQAIAHSVRTTVAKNVPLGQRAQAAGQLLSLAALVVGTTAAANYIRKASGNDQAYLRKVGPLSAVDTAESAYRLLAGKKNSDYEDKTLDSAMSGLFELAPGTKAIGQVIPGVNRDAFTGKPIINYQGKPQDIAEQAAVYGAEQFSPIQQLESIIKGSKDVPSTLTSMFGVNFPTPKQVAGRQYFQNKDNYDFDKAWMRKKKQLGLDKVDHIFGGD